MKTRDISDKEYCEILRIANGDDTHWDKQQKNYVDQNGNAQTLISYNDLLSIVKRAMMAGTVIVGEQYLLGNMDTPCKFKLLKHQDDDGSCFAAIMKKK